LLFVFFFVIILPVFPSVIESLATLPSPLKAAQPWKIQGSKNDNPRKKEPSLTTHKHAFSSVFFQYEKKEINPS